MVALVTLITVPLFYAKMKKMEDYTVKTDHTVNDWATLVPDDLAQGVEPKLIPESAPDESAAPGEDVATDENAVLGEGVTNKDAGMTDERRAEVARRAYLYRGRLTLSAVGFEMNTKSIDDLAEGMEKDKSPEERQAEAFIKQLSVLDDSQIEQIEKVLEDTDKSLRFQYDKDIIDHKKINTKDALEKELQSGSAIPELDIRFDKDGKAWISHSQRSGARFFFSKPIHEMTSEEVAAKGQRLSLEDGLKMISEYYKDNQNHRVVLELKELGPSAETHKPYLESIQKMLKENGLTDAAIFATLSPDVLMDTHEIFPDNPKIFNGGIAPVISYNLAERSAQDVSGKEIKVKLPNVELYLSDSSEVTRRADGYGKQTGYLWMRLPRAVVSTLREMREKGSVGSASLTLVNKVAGVIEKVFPKFAKKMRKHYADQLHSMGLDIQVAIPKRNPGASFKRAKEQMGNESLIYANDDHIADWTLELIKEEEEERRKAA